MKLTKEQSAQVTEALKRAFMVVAPRDPSERPATYYGRMLMWSLTTPEGRAALKAAYLEVL